jgi:hypothetical protein
MILKKFKELNKPPTKLWVLYLFFDENHWFLENQNWHLLDFEFFFKTTWTDDFLILKYF